MPNQGRQGHSSFLRLQRLFLFFCAYSSTVPSYSTSARILPETGLRSWRLENLLARPRCCCCPRADLPSSLSLCSTGHNLFTHQRSRPCYLCPALSLRGTQHEDCCCCEAGKAQAVQKLKILPCVPHPLYSSHATIRRSTEIRVRGDMRHVYPPPYHIQSESGDKRPSLPLRVYTLVVCLVALTSSPSCSEDHTGTSPQKSALLCLPGTRQGRCAVRRWFVAVNKHGTFRFAVAAVIATINTKTTTNTSAASATATGKSVYHGGFAFQLFGQRPIKWDADEAPCCRDQLRGQISAGRAAPTKLGTDESNASVG